LFDVINMVWGFKSFVVVVFFVEINEVCLGLSLTATAWAVSGIMTRLSALKTIVVSIS